MTGKLLILAGAPESHRLDWTTPDLLSTFQTSIAQFAQLAQPQAQQLPHPPLTATQQQQQQPEPEPEPEPEQDRSYLDLAGWRSLPLERTHIRTGFSQQHDLHFIGAFPLSADFLTTASIFVSQGPISQDDADSEGQEEEEAANSSRRLLADFYEHSLAVHDDIASSQLVLPGPDSQRTGTSDTSFVSDTNSHSRSFTSDEGGDTTMAEEGRTGRPLLRPPLKPGWGGGGGGGGADHLSDLEDIPPASYLLSITPQTMTVTLIAGIISIAAPRTVHTRFGTTKTLVEVLVGDETKSGFSVTFWLSNAADDAEGVGVGGVLAGLRGQDVVLMQNVALNVFQKRVYGGSLRKDMTRVHLLYRGRLIDKGDVGGYYSYADLAKVGRIGESQGHPQLEKTRRVRDWVLKFVGGGVGAPAGGGANKTTKSRKGNERAPPRAWNHPPPLDSQ